MRICAVRVVRIDSIRTDSRVVRREKESKGRARGTTDVEIDLEREREREHTDGGDGDGKKRVDDAARGRINREVGSV